MLSDIDISRNAKLLPIAEIARGLKLEPDDIENYGQFIAKINDSAFHKVRNNSKGKLVLVTSINPTPAGEGKTTITIGLSQALRLLGKKAVVALREPSLGPVFGLKGGATGGGYSQVLPMEKINLQFTGDMPAITAANNLLCAMIDNHLKQGNELGIDPSKVVFHRAADINDRALRNVVVQVDKAKNITRSDNFQITAASEVMAILCLASDVFDLRRRLGQIIVAYDYSDQPVYCSQLKAEGAMTVLLVEAIKPNLVQTVENGPAIIHGGPFANIAHGCNSIRALNFALKTSDFCITEAGFGSDLGGEKFIDIVSRLNDSYPDVVVIVATIRALKYHGGVNLPELNQPNESALVKGLDNLAAHLKIMKQFDRPIVVAINKYGVDNDQEIELVKQFCSANQVSCAVCSGHDKGGQGGIELAKTVIALANKTNSEPTYIYDLADSIEAKINKVATKVYGAKTVIFSDKARTEISRINLLSLNKPICIAKTQSSLSDDPKKLGWPRDFELHINDVYILNGAGFVVAKAGNILTMPGLPKHPAAESINIDEHGNIIGIF